MPGAQANRFATQIIAQQQQQGLHAADVLFQAPGQESQADAGARLRGVAADFFQNLPALIQQHQDVFFVFGLLRRIMPPRQVVLEKMPGLDVLHEEWRLELLDGRLVAQNLRLQAQRRDAIGNHLCRIEHLLQRLVQRRAIGLHVKAQSTDKFSPIFYGHTFHPDLVRRPVENEAQHVLERIGVDHVGQHRMGNPAP